MKNIIVALNPSKDKDRSIEYERGENYFRGAGG